MPNPTRRVIAACVAAVAFGAVGSHVALMPTDVAAASPRITEDDPRWDCYTMGNRICGPTATPYCGYDWYTPRWLDVAGPAGGRITVNGHAKGRLVLVDEDTADESLWDGLRANVRIKRHHKHLVVRVNGHVCDPA